MLFRFLAQIGYTFLVIVETLISLRFILKLINVQPVAKIVAWLYSITDKMLSPFTGIVPESVKFLGFTIELTTLLVIALISLCAYALYEIIKAYS
jgi:uncharacterized protein YggT (Ycf19 family)